MRNEQHLNAHAEGAVVPKKTTAGLSDWLPLSVLVLGGLLAGLVHLVEPSDPNRVTAIFPPWWSSEQTFIAASAAGAVVAIGSYPFIISVQGQEPGVGKRLRTYGAIAIVDGSGFLLCGPRRTTAQ